MTNLIRCINLSIYINYRRKFNTRSIIVKKPAIPLHSTQKKLLRFQERTILSQKRCQTYNIFLLSYTGQKEKANVYCLQFTHLLDLSSLDLFIILVLLQLSHSSWFYPNLPKTFKREKWKRRRKERERKKERLIMVWFNLKLGLNI